MKFARICARVIAAVYVVNALSVCRLTTHADSQTILSSRSLSDKLQFVAIAQLVTDIDKLKFVVRERLGEETKQISAWPAH